MNIAGWDPTSGTSRRREIDVAKIDIQIVQAEDHIWRILVFDAGAASPTDAQIIGLHADRGRRYHGSGIDIAISESASAVEQDRTRHPAETRAQGAEIFDVGVGIGGRERSKNSGEHRIEISLQRRAGNISLEAVYDRTILPVMARANAGDPAD